MQFRHENDRPTATAIRFVMVLVRDGDVLEFEGVVELRLRRRRLVVVVVVAWNR